MADKLTDKQVADIQSRFDFHDLKEGQAELINEIRVAVVATATLINLHCPSCRESSLALTHLEEVMYFADASIVRNGKAISKAEPEEKTTEGQPS